MTHNKKDLAKSIKLMEQVLADPDTDASTKESIEASLPKAKALMAELNKPALVATSASASTTGTEKSAGKKKSGKPTFTKRQQKRLTAFVNASKEYAAYAGKTESQLQRDSKRKAMRPGKRISSSGKKYSETRANRSDVSASAPHLAKGGKVKSDDWMKSVEGYRAPTGFKKGDHVTFDSDKVEVFKSETNGNDRSIRQYRELVLAGVNQIGIVKGKLDENMTMVSYPEDNWELPIPTKYLVLLPTEGKAYAEGGQVPELEAVDFKRNAKGKTVQAYAAIYEPGTFYYVVSKGKNEFEVMGKKGKAPEYRAVDRVYTEPELPRRLAMANAAGMYSDSPLYEYDGDDYAKGGKVGKTPKAESLQLYAGDLVHGYKSTHEKDVFYYAHKYGEYRWGVWQVQHDGAGFSGSVSTKQFSTQLEALGLAKQMAIQSVHPKVDWRLWEKIEYGLGGMGTSIPASILKNQNAIEEIQKGITQIEAEKQDGQYYKGAISAMQQLVVVIGKVLDTTKTSTAETIFSDLQSVGVYNYRTGLVVNTEFINRALARRYKGKSFKSGGEIAGAAGAAATSAASTPVPRGGGTRVRVDAPYGGAVKTQKKGGPVGRNLSRDRKFKSQESWEQSYDRKTNPKNPHYKKHKKAEEKKTGGPVKRNLSRDRKFKSQESWEQNYQRKTNPKNPHYKKHRKPTLSAEVKAMLKKAKKDKKIS